MNKVEAFEVLIAGLICGLVISFPSFENYREIVLISVVSLFLHTLSHKFVAKRINLIANFKLWVRGTISSVGLTLLLSIFAPLKILCFEGLEIAKYRFKVGKRKLTYEEVGIISLAGPTVNLLLAILLWIFQTPLSPLIVSVNCWLALFTILPIEPLDGSRIFYWKKWVWLLFLILSIFLLYAI
jgi:Zn-dependent protease